MLLTFHVLVKHSCSHVIIQGLVLVPTVQSHSRDGFYQVLLSGVKAEALRFGLRSAAGFMEGMTDTQQELPGNVTHSVQLCFILLSWCTHLLVFLLWDRMRSQVLLRRVPVAVWMPAEVVALCLDALGLGGALEKQC